MRIKLLIIGCCLFGVVFQLYSQGYIVPNGVIYVDNSPSPISEIDVIYNPNDFPPKTSDYTGFFLNAQNLTTFSFDYIVNVGIRVFLVSPNNPITENTVLSGIYPELTTPNSYVFALNNPFYVALYTGTGLPQNGIYPDPLFGWAQLVNNNGMIGLLDGALEYKGGGIFAGTQTIIPVPEPRAFALLAVAGLLCGFRFTRRMKT